MICIYIKSIRQHQPGSTITRKDVRITCMTMVDHDAGWLESVKSPGFNIDGVMRRHNEYIDKSYARVGQIFK